MPNIKELNSSLAKFATSTAPLVVVLAGGTTGIGSYIAHVLATTFQHEGHKLRVYIIGRNAQRGNAVIAESQQLCKGSEWSFIQVDDLAEMDDVYRACEEITSREEAKPFAGGKPTVDLLYLTYSVSIMKERAETSTGLDALMSTLYYTRIRFILRLLPLLTASPLAGHVISVYAGAMEHHTLTSPSSPLPIGTPSDDAYNITTVRRHVSFMKTFFFESLARQHEGKILLTHIYPGLVDGPGFYSSDNPLWFRILWRMMKPVMRVVYMTSAEDCGKVMVSLAGETFAARGSEVEGAARGTDGVVGGGAYALGRFGDVESAKAPAYDVVRSGDAGERVWEHTMGIAGQGLEK